MAIQMKRGELAYLDKSRLSAGEMVVATDEDYIGVAKAPSNVVQLATMKDVKRKGNIYAVVDGCLTFYSLQKKKYVIFNDGEFDNVPDGLDIEENIQDTNNGINSLSAYFNTNKTLWVHAASVMETWGIGDGLLSSNYSKYDNQNAKNAIYIPIEQLTTAETLKITARGNLRFSMGYILNNQFIRSNEKKICSETFVEEELDVSNYPKMEYVVLSSPTLYAEDEEIQTDLPQPVPFAMERVYTTNNQQGKPGFEYAKATGDDDVYFLIVPRKPDNAPFRIFAFSKSAFTVTRYTRIYNGGQEQTATLTGAKISGTDTDTIYAIDNEIGSYYSYRYEDFEWYDCNYSGGWTSTWTYQLGKILLYGNTNVLDGHGLQATHETNSWITGFPQPVPLVGGGSCYIGYSVDYYTYDGHHITRDNVGFIDAVGEGDIYGIIIFDIADPEDKYVEVYAISDKPFTARWWIDAGSNESISEWGEPEDSYSITYHGITYYVSHDWAWLWDYEIVTSVPDYIDYSDIPNSYLSPGDLTGEGIWAMAYIALDGEVSGGALQEIKKIEVISDEEN